MSNLKIAYDIYVLAQFAREFYERFDGWIFGLPPGIQSEEWPLDPANGYPLVHGFTLRLPEDYRCHGPDIVAISFFGTPWDHNDGGPATNKRVAEALASDTPPDDADLLTIWQAYRHNHPRLRRMVDILGCHYAVILLTQQEFDAAFCRPPALVRGDVLASVPPPRWLSSGSAKAMNDMVYTPHTPSDGDGVPRDDVTEAKQISFNRALKLMPRTTDPNAGKSPVTTYDDEPSETGYQSHLYRVATGADSGSYHVHSWTKGHASDHLGGTMRPCQIIPAGFSPYYIEFEEYFGGFNFGMGNAQLDFKNMLFDWAC